MGQFREIHNLLVTRFISYESRDYEESMSLLEKLKRIFFPDFSFNGGPGIVHKDCDEWARLAYEIQYSIKSQIDNLPDEYISHPPPFKNTQPPLKVTEEPFPDVEVLKINENQVKQ